MKGKMNEDKIREVTNWGGRKIALLMVEKLAKEQFTPIDAFNIMSNMGLRILKQSFRTMRASGMSHRQLNNHLLRFRNDFIDFYDRFLQEAENDCNDR